MDETESALIYHIYTNGRFGPERHLGFIIAHSPACIRISSYIGFDIVQELVVLEGFFRNPLGIVSLKKYRKWQKQYGGQRSGKCQTKKNNSHCE